MIFGLKELPALARVCYHAQELAVLMSKPSIDVAAAGEIKSALDEAYLELIYPPEGKNGPN